MIISEKTRRKDSSTGSETDANIQDVIAALTKLDRAEQMPVFVIDYLSISTIPKSHPE